jgi:hypothetical protein
MLLRRTIIFIPQGQTETFKVKIYTGGDSDDTALWNVDTNEVLLSNRLYSEFRSCKTQAEQKRFFDRLQKTSAALLAQP